MSPPWHHQNLSPTDIPDPPSPSSPNQKFTLTSPPNTDIWRPSPQISTFTAPHITTSLPLSSFLRARVTVSANWTTLYDQGGLLIIFPDKNSNHQYNDKQGNSASPGPQTRWLKAGIEFFDSAPKLGVVATDRVSDWSLAPLPLPGHQNQEGERGRGQVEAKATIEISAEKESAWVYVIEGEGKKRRALREVKWGFNGGEEGEVRVGVYVATPAEKRVGGEVGELVVQFEGLEVESKEGRVV